MGMRQGPTEPSEFTVTFWFGAIIGRLASALAPREKPWASPIQ